MEKWYVSAKKADFDKWAKDFQISPIVARILRNRDMTEEEEVRKFLHGTLEDCYSAWLLKDMDKAVERILKAVDSKVPIRVIGDYDVDGICSSYILTKGLQILGAIVDTAIPHRIHDGYGLNEHLIEAAAQSGIRMIITCDNGISAVPQIEQAAALGMEVVVTDHHEVPYIVKEGMRIEQLPQASAVVDPKRADCGYPYKNICGGVVAYKLIEALAERTGNEDLREAKGEMLAFAALATVCDVMELRDENRVIVKEGLKRLKHTKNPGLKALMEVNEIAPEKLSVYHLGFVLGPCLNATGRLDSAKHALELLQSTKKAESMTAARELVNLNENRKKMTLQGVEEAEQFIRKNHMEQDKVMIIYLPQVHESLAGIIAGRVREKYNHPVFILTKGEEGVKGSGRSVENYHMYEAMTRVKHYFTKFGGHKLAAGLSMEEENIDSLRRAMNEDCNLTEEDFLPKVTIDVPMPLCYADEGLVKELELLEPFGVGNPQPLFAQKDLVFLAGYRMGANQTCARFKVRTPENTQQWLVFFGDLERFGNFLETKFGQGSEERLYNGKGEFLISVVYRLGLNTYKGKTQIQFLLQYYC